MSDQYRSVFCGCSRRIEGDSAACVKASVGLVVSVCLCRSGSVFMSVSSAAIKPCVIYSVKCGGAADGKLHRPTLF